MSKKLFLLSLATITLAATALTNVASSRADSISIVGSGSSSSSPKLTVAPPTYSAPSNGDRVCAAVYPPPPACASPSPTPIIPIPPSTYHYPAPVSPYPQPPMSEIPVPIH